MEVHRGSSMDEIQQYVDARWICAPEAFWKIFQFTLYRLYPYVERLQIHLPNRHQVPYYNHQRIADVLNDDRNSKTMLTQFFALNRRDPHSRKYLYRDSKALLVQRLKNGIEEFHHKGYWENLFYDPIIAFFKAY
ncbi:hypothetical protein QL285_006342 [Trifolium repens]|nr:hypothetical protein QL285_006342 [Trifolium repens]